MHDVELLREKLPGLEAALAADAVAGKVIRARDMFTALCQEVRAGCNSWSRFKHRSANMQPVSRCVWSLQSHVADAIQAIRNADSRGGHASTAAGSSFERRAGRCVTSPRGPSFVGLTPLAALPGYLLDGVCREGIAPILLALGLDRSQVDVLTSLTVQRPNVRSRPGRRRNAHRLGEVDMLIVRKCGQGHEHTAECHQVRGSGVNYVL